MAFGAVALLFACTAVLIPSNSGRMLFAAVKQVKAFTSASTTPGGAPFAIEIIRDNPVSILGHELALSLLPASARDANPKAAAVMQELHDEGVVKAFSADLMGGSCTVVVSAQSMDLKDGMMPNLAQRLGSEPAAWRLILLHESAHCLRNVAAERLQAIQRHKWVEKNPMHNELFAAFLTEAYADAYAMLALSAMNNQATGAPYDVQQLGRDAIAWRRGTSSGPAYRTEGAIQAAIDMAGQSKDDLSTKTAAQLDRMAMQSALAGSAVWFQFMKSTPQEIAPEFMARLTALAKVAPTSPQGTAHE